MNLQDMKSKGTQISPASELNQYFTKHRAQLAAALPKHITPDRMARLALTAFSQNKLLAQCDAKSIFASVVVASQLGLEPGVNGQCYLVPYAGKCTLVPGWRGLVDLVARSGRATVWTGAVFAGDDFDYGLGTDPFIRHKPSGEDDINALTHVYAVGKVKGSELPVIEVWPIAKVIKHRQKTVNPKLLPGHYSHKHLEMYARKVCLLQVLKYMPMSIELSNALAADESHEMGKTGEIISGDFVVVDEPATEQQGEEPEVQL